MGLTTVDSPPKVHTRGGVAYAGGGMGFSLKTKLISQGAHFFPRFLAEFFSRADACGGDFFLRFLPFSFISSFQHYIFPGAHFYAPHYPPFPSFPIMRVFFFLDFELDRSRTVPCMTPPPGKSSWVMPCFFPCPAGRHHRPRRFRPVYGCRCLEQGVIATHTHSAASLDRLLMLWVKPIHDLHCDNTAQRAVFSALFFCVVICMFSKSIIPLVSNFALIFDRCLSFPICLTCDLAMFLLFLSRCPDHF